MSIYQCDCCRNSVDYQNCMCECHRPAKERIAILESSLATTKEALDAERSVRTQIVDDADLEIHRLREALAKAEGELLQSREDLIAARQDNLTLTEEARADEGHMDDMREQLTTSQARAKEVEQQRDVLQTLFYEAQEHLCSCNIVDTTKPVGDPYNYVCEWHEKYQRHVIARAPLLTLANQIGAAEARCAQLEGELARKQGDHEHCSALCERLRYKLNLHCEAFRMQMIGNEYQACMDLLAEVEEALASGAGKGKG